MYSRQLGPSATAATLCNLRPIVVRSPPQRVLAPSDTQRSGNVYQLNVMESSSVPGSEMTLQKRTGRTAAALYKN